MKKGVLVAMSGGVDSSVALHKILKMGYKPIGVTMKLWDNKDPKTNVGLIVTQVFVVLIIVKMLFF